MDLDLRVPVGLLFVTLGLIMAIFGLTSDPAIYHKSLGINVNLDWGIVELIFGSLMIAFGRPRHHATSPQLPELARSAAMTLRDTPPPQDTPPPAPPGAKPPVAHG